MQACRSLTALPVSAVLRFSRRAHGLRYCGTTNNSNGAHAVPNTTLQQDDTTRYDRRVYDRAGQTARSSPSSDLINALRTAGHDHALPEEPKLHKVDLSFIKPGSNYRAILGEDGNNSDKVNVQEGEKEINLQSILARYFQQDAMAMSEVSPTKPVEIQSSLQSDGLAGIPDSEGTRPMDERDEDSQQLLAIEDKILQERGYGREDVKHWARLLQDRNSESVARIMLAHQREDGAPERKPLPVFLLLFFLRRPYLSPEALRFCLVLGWQEVNRRRLVLENAAQYEERYVEHEGVPILDGHSHFLLIIRLLRHARIVWSDALVTIAAMFSQYYKDTYCLPLKTLPASHAARLTVLYNRMLVLVGLPVSRHPFHSIKFPERAQFDLVRDMTLFDPPLQINREGYRSITSVQLAQKKTDQERDWDKLKARSWPPWKQDQTGLDAAKDREYGTSRAMQVLNRAREAGYGMTNWERAASILAGWDVDLTPTIQKRALLLHKVVSRRTAVQAMLSTDPKLWRARIAVARTLQEAWAFFLRYKVEAPYMDVNVYMAMLTKIAAEDKRLLALQSRRSTLIKHLIEKRQSISSGDGLEVVAPPESPHETPYLSAPPASFDELVTEMFENGLRPQGYQLSCLLNMAKTLEQGVEYLVLSSVHVNSDLDSLLSAAPEGDDRLTRVIGSVFAAWIGLLCRFPVVTFKPERIVNPEVKVLGFLNGERPVLHALRLLRACRPVSRRPWNAVLETLGKPYVTARLRRHYTKDHPERFEHSTVIQGVFESMSAAGIGPNSDTLRILCNAMEPAIIDAQNIVADFAAKLSRRKSMTLEKAKSKKDDDKDIVRFSAHLLAKAPQYLQSIFSTVMGLGKKKAPAEIVQVMEAHKLPRLLTVPHVESLHAYVRVTGAIQDWQGIFNLVEFMVRYKDEIVSAAAMPRNGQEFLRRTLVAVRVYLERSWVEEKVERADLQPATEKTVKKVKKMVEKSELFGGWPDDDEVADYCTRGRFPGQARIDEVASR